MAQIAAAARTQSSISITLTADGGETAWLVEVNRAADFSSDDSLTFATGAAGNQTFNGMPAGQNFYIRARKTNGGNGAWSTTVIHSTLPPNAVPAYGGFSIDKALLVVPEPLTWYAGTNIQAGYPTSRLGRDDPASTCRLSNDTAAIPFETPGRPIDTIALMGIFGSDAGEWRMQSFPTRADQVAGTNPTLVFDWTVIKASPALVRRYAHGMVRFASTSARFFTISFRTLAWGMICRHLIVGAQRSSVNYSRGAGSAPNDMGRLQRNRFGTPDRTSGWRGRSIDFELSWLTEAEYQAKWADLAGLVGTTDPVFVLTNSKVNGYMQDRMGLGAIRQARDENVRGSRYVKSIELDSLY